MPRAEGILSPLLKKRKVYKLFEDNMPKQKQKTHKGLAKRVKLTARGRIKYRKAGKGHLMSVKSAKHLRRIRRPATVANKALEKKMVAALHS